VLVSVGIPLGSFPLSTQIRVVWILRFASRNAMRLPAREWLGLQAPREIFKDAKEVVYPVASSIMALALPL